MGRLGRQKKYRKILKYYKINFKISAPFKVLLDGNFIHAALKNSVTLNEKIPKVLNDSTCDLLVPTIVLDELKKIGDPVKETLYQAETFKKHKYGKGDTPSEVILDIIGQFNRNRFVVCTQDTELRHELQKIPGVPLIYMNKASIVIEPPSLTSKSELERREQKKSEPKREERRRLQEKMDGASLSSAGKQHANHGSVNPLNLTGKKHGIKRAKEPNPLSVKKKKKRVHENDAGGSTEKSSTKKVRRKKRRK